MQNTPQTFRGAGAPGVNFSDRSYDSHLGAHCQPTGYQPYPNQPYHPLPSQRHHYGNHQMQQNMQYRHHSNAYPPNQNQYGSNMNQDMYRNHSGYPGPANRNMSSKPWSENNSSGDMMTPYGHSQVMNNAPSQMPVTTMRSPPHATSNMQPAPPPQGQQHYRQMQSPAHSPHSWSQAQIPSPGVMHSSRTTPSPLSTHARSPGHSQPFSPPSAHTMNIPPHQQQPSENGQIPQAINVAAGNDQQNPSNPLHSLQKMVMCDQDPKAMISMMGDGTDQFSNHCGPHNYVPEENVNTASKDSPYSTYYNMDENRFESKPSGSSNYSPVQQMSNCNFPVPPQIVNSEEIQNSPISSSNSSTNVTDCLQLDQNLLPSPANSVPPVAHSQLIPNTVQNDCTTSLAECPPHAESAPVFTDQTKAAVSTNSEQALESKPEESCVDKVQVEVDPNCNILEKQNSIPGGELSHDTLVHNSGNEAPESASLELKNLAQIQSSEQSNSKSDEVLKSSSPHTSEDSNKLISDKLKNDSNLESSYSSFVTVSAEIHKSDEGEKDEQPSETIKQTSSDNNLVEMPSDNISSTNAVTDSKPCVTSCNNPNSSNSDNPSNLDKPALDKLKRHPVKVVIHRIRKDDENDTWHVPDGEGSSDSCKNVIETKSGKKSGCKIPNVGPQIVILSPDKPERKFSFTSSVDNSIITVKEEDEDDNEAMVINERTQNDSDNENIKSEHNSSKFSRSPDKKRGRPMGSKNKIKPGGSVKKKGKRGSKRKKFENSKLKNAEALSKTKRMKVFSGPYVHLTGTKENPSSISVVNVAQKEEEKVSKIPVKRTFASTTNRLKKKPVGHLSTLSPTYDAFNRDKTWLCIFCQKGSHHGGLGDLYGPYYIKDKNYGSKLPSPSSNIHGRGKKRKSDHEDRASKKSKQAAGHSAVESTPNSRHCEEESSDPDSQMKETWIHEDCAVWCQSITLLGEDVQGLEEAVTEAYENKCCKCSLFGATLGCWGKSCKELYHYSCAKETGCQMDIENFSLLCPSHQKNSPDRRNRCQ